MQVVINGAKQDIAADTTVAELVDGYRLEPKHVAVEVNCDLVPRRQYESTTLNEGDRVEIVTLVGGG